MLRIKTLAFALPIITLINCSVLRSEPNSKQAIPQSKSGKLSTQKSSNQIVPSDNLVTRQQMIDAISHAIEATANKANTNQNPPPPDNSGWWFSLFLVIFTGGLVAVGIGQCYIIFKTLKETQKAADAAKKSANALQAIERARLSIKVMPDPPRKEPIIGIEAGHNRVKVIMINEGNSLATITKINCYIGIMNDKEIANKISELKSATSEYEYGFITIKEKASKDIPVMSEEITSSDLQKIDYSTTFFVCLGHIRYKDVFREVRDITVCWKDTGTYFAPDSKYNEGA